MRVFAITVLLSSVGVFASDECVNGKSRCTDVSTDYCENGKWVATMCPKGTKCLGYGDWMCHDPVKHAALEEKLRHIWGNVETDKPGEMCNHGDFRCTDVSTDRCDRGKWFAYPCALGTRCVGCDFECLTPLDYPVVRDQFCPTFNIPKPNEVCTNGQKRCTMHSSDVCLHGKWEATPCAAGTKCLACAGFTCVADSDWKTKKNETCPSYEAPKYSYPETSEVMSSANDIEISSLMSLLVAAAGFYYA